MTRSMSSIDTAPRRTIQGAVRGDVATLRVARTRMRDRTQTNLPATPRSHRVKPQRQNCSPNVAHRWNAPFHTQHLAPLTGQPPRRELKYARLAAYARINNLLKLACESR
jgi:hypothetical protein